MTYLDKIPRKKLLLLKTIIGMAIAATKEEEEDHSYAEPAPVITAPVEPVKIIPVESVTVIQTTAQVHAEEEEREVTPPLVVMEEIWPREPVDLSTKIVTKDATPTKTTTTALVPYSPTDLPYSPTPTLHSPAYNPAATPYSPTRQI